TLTAVWRDTDGAVTAIANDYVRLVQAQGVTAFNVSVPGDATGVPTAVFLTPLAEPYRQRPVDAALTLQEHWFHGDAESGFTWGAIVANSGTSVWRGSYLTAKFYDADGRLLAADNAYFHYIRPGSQAVLG